MDRLSDVGYMTELLHQLGVAKLLIDPRFRGIQKELLDLSTLDRFHREAADLVDAYWNGDDENEGPYELFDVVLITGKMLQSCLYNFFLGTAVYVSHDMKGRIAVDEDIAEMAVSDVKSFLNKHGLMNLFLCYRVIVGFESHKALAYYGSMTEKEFLSGEIHRPGAADALEGELLIGLAAEFYERFEKDNEPCIRLTDSGQARIKDEYRMLMDSRYLDFRMQVMYVSQFDQLHDWDHLLQKILPGAIQKRREFVDFVGVKPGMEVLELGCGTGVLTFEGGLAERVGKKGWVTATDPSTGMLHRAALRLDRSGYENVSLEAAAAEQIPYGDHEFDCVLGVSFFHFTDNDRAFNEMIRVTRPGGTIGLFGPLAIDWNIPFFREWFEEIFALAKKRGADAPSSHLASEGEMAAFFKEKGLENVTEEKVVMPWLFPDPETVIRFMVYGTGFFQRELILLPVAARKVLIGCFIEKGKDICRKYAEDERQISFPGYFVKGNKGDGHER